MEAAWSTARRSLEKKINLDNGSDTDKIQKPAACLNKNIHHPILEHFFFDNTERPRVD